MVYRGKLGGLIYLENNSTTAAFTPENINTLKLISSQAEISIENARLYQDISKINKSFERFVPKNFLELLGKEKVENVELGDNLEKELTILFVDIRDFTTLSENMEPAIVFQFLNDYLSHLGPVATKHNGFIDKFIGDAIMALFPHNPQDAINAAIEMQEVLKEFNQKNQVQGLPQIEIGIGINSGKAMLGTLGEIQRMEGTVISDAVNTSSRIEALNKTYETGILVSKATIDKVENQAEFKLRLIDKIRV